MFNDGEVRIGTSLDTSGFEKDAKILKKEAEQVDQEVSQSLTKTTKVGNSLGSSLGNVAKKIVGLGSALFDVVAVGGLLGAMATGVFILSKALDKANGDTEQLKTNLSYIGFVASKIFENLLQPAIDKTTGAINGLVGALYKMVVYVGYILSAWTGKDLFAGTGVEDYAKSMENANKSAKSTAKATKQIKKDLMGFDEVNKLSDNATSSNIGGVSTPGGNLPNLPNLGDVKIPGWVEWIAENKDKIIEVAKWVLALLTFSKVVSWLEPLGSFFGLFTGDKLAGGIQTVGDKIKGLFTTSNKLFGGWSGFLTGLLISIPLIVATVENAKKKLKETYEQQDKISEQGANYSKEFVENTDDLVELNEDLNYRQNMTKQNLKKLNQFGSSIYKQIYKSVGATDSWVKNTNDTLRNSDDILKKEIDLYRQGKLTDEQKRELIKKISDQRSLLDDVYSAYELIGEDTSGIVEMNDYYKNVLGEIGVVVDDNNKKIDYSVDSIDRFGFNAGKAKTSVGQIGDAIMGVADKVTGADKKTDTWFGKLSGIKDKIVQIANQPLPKKELKVEVNADTSKAKKALQDMLQSWAKGPTGNLLKKLGFDDIVGKIANIKLARGGIINNPGRGVSLGTNIIGGEAGAEAVLPLDDRTMDRLGQSIARHMTINATMINQMNGRTLSREVKQIMNESNFTYNL